LKKRKSGGLSLNTKHADVVANKFYSIGPLNISAIPQPVLGGLLLLLYAAFMATVLLYCLRDEDTMLSLG